MTWSPSPPLKVGVGFNHLHELKLRLMKRTKPTKLAISKKLSDYTLLKKLGTGKSSTIHLGIDNNTEKSYAIKIYQKSSIQDLSLSK